MHAELAELRRLIENIVRYGTIAEIDYDEKLVRVRMIRDDDEEDGTGNTTDWIQWSEDAGDTSEWNPPSIGEQVTVLSPGGNISGGTAFRGKYSDAFPAPSSSPTLHKRQYPDGAVIEYDHASHALRAILPAGSSSARVKADLFVADALTSIFTGDVFVYGNQVNSKMLTVNQSLSVLGQGGSGESVSIAGTVRMLADAIIGGISFLRHRHQVPAVGGLTEEPE